MNTPTRLTLIFFFAILFLEKDSYAQDSIRNRRNYSRLNFSRAYLFGGPSSVLIRGDNRYPSAFKLGYSLGIGATHYWGKHFGLQERLLWETKGYKEDTGSTIYELKNSYFTASLIPQWIFGKQNQFNLGAGLYIGSLQKSNMTIRYITSGTSTSYSALDSYNKFDYGFVFNLGFTSKPYRNFVFTFQFNDNYGLNGIVNWNIPSPLFPPWYNNTYSLLLGITRIRK